MGHQRQDFCHVGCYSTFTLQHAGRKKSRERRGHLCNVSHLSGTDGGGLEGLVAEWGESGLCSIFFDTRNGIETFLENPPRLGKSTKNQFGDVKLPCFSASFHFKKLFPQLTKCIPKEIHGELSSFGRCHSHSFPLRPPPCDRSMAR